MIGFHRYDRKPIFADLDSYWLQGGLECCKCHKQKISFKEASGLAKRSYERGKLNAENSFLAYGKGVNSVIELYGKAYVQKND